MPPKICGCPDDDSPALNFRGPRRVLPDVRWIIPLLGLLVIGASCGERMGNGAPSDGNGSVPSVITVVPNGGSAGDGMVFPASQFDDERKVADHEMPRPSDLPFAASFPKSAGVPLSVYVVKPGSMPSGETQVRAEYDTSSPWGAFRVTEGSRPPLSSDPSEAESISRFCQDTGGNCTSKLVHLSPTIAAGLLYGPDGPTSVTWVERFDDTAYRFVVMGPSGAFTPDIAIRVSTEVAAGFTPAST